jgi:signal transduction histidine kinase
LTWQFSIYSLPLLAAAAVAFSLGWYAWRRKTVPGAGYFAWLMLAVGEWALVSALEFAVQEPSSKIFWSKLSYLGIVSAPPLWALFAAHYTQHPGWLARRRGLAVWIIPLVTLLLVWSNEWHHIHWAGVSTLSPQPGSPLVYDYGPWFWVYAAYAYGMMLYGSILLGRLALRSPRPYSFQAGMLLLGAIVPWIGNFLYLSGLNPFPGLDLTPVFFTLTGLLVAANIFELKLFDLMPVAHDALFENMNIGVMVLDARQRIVDLNPAGQRLLDLSGDVLGQPAQIALAALPQLFAYACDDVPAPVEICLEQVSPPIWLEVSTTLLYDRRQQLSGRLVTFQDIGDRRRAEAQMRIAHQQALEASQMKTQLLANVSHDLRTPLGAIIGFADMLRSGVYGEMNEGQCQAANEIIDSADDLLVFVNNLISQAQIETGKVVIKNRLFNLVELVEASLSTAIVLANKKGLSLNYKIDTHMPGVILGDPYWLRQVIYNLVDNAVKFTGQGGVDVKICPPDDQHWIIQVTDTGIGIPEEVQELVFESFRQADGAMAYSQSGTGLGLSIVKELAVLMGGRVELSSNPGQGSTFAVILPLIKSQEVNP